MKRIIELDFCCFLALEYSGEKLRRIQLYGFMRIKKLWLGGYYQFIHSYCGFYGNYSAGKVYKLSWKLARVFGPAGDIQEVPEHMKHRIKELKNDRG